MSALNLNTASFARVLGVSDSTVRNYFDTERNTKPGYEVLERLYHSFGTVNLPWLFGSEGQPLLNTVAEERAQYQTSENNSGNIIGTNNGTATVHNLTDCEKDLIVAKEKITLLASQLEVQTKYIKLLEAHQSKP